MDSDFRIEGFSLPHLLVIFILIGLAIFIFYWLWTSPCGDEDRQPAVAFLDGRYERSAPQREAAAAAGCCNRGDKAGEGLCVLYATEIEPGTIVLQSPNGELFRVLRELDAVSSGASPISGLPPGTSHPVYYIPSYTRPHLLTQPSAPPAYSLPGDGVATTSGYSAMPVSAGGSSVPGDWRPLYISSASQY